MKTLLFAILSLAACTAWSQEAAQPQTVPATPPVKGEAPCFGCINIGAPVPDFTVVNEKGANTTLADFKGRTVVVHFFTGARPQPFLQKMAKTYGKSVSVLAVNMAPERKDFDAWLAAGKSGASYPVAWDPAGSNRDQSVARKSIGISSFPATVVIDGEGKLVDGVTGFGEFAEAKVYFALDRAGVPLLAADKPKAAPPQVVKAGSDAPRPKTSLLAAGTAAPDFVMQDLDGKDIHLSDFKGKVVVLDFWATWCGPCKAAMPHLETVHQATKDKDVVVLASCTSDTREAFEKWVTDNMEQYTFLFAHDANGKSADSASKKLYGVTGIPSQFVIGRDGVIIDGILGANHKRLAAALEKAGVTLPADDGEQNARN